MWQCKARPLVEFLRDERFGRPQPSLVARVLGRLDSTALGVGVEGSALNIVAEQPLGDLGLLGGVIGLHERAHAAWLPGSDDQRVDPILFEQTIFVTPSLSRPIDWYLRGGLAFRRAHDSNSLIDEDRIAFEPVVEGGLAVRWLPHFTLTTGVTYRTAISRLRVLTEVSIPVKGRRTYMTGAWR